MARTRHRVAARLGVRSPAERMIAALAPLARIRRALAVVSALLALMLSTPAALALPCPPGTIIERIGNNLSCVKCPQLTTPNASQNKCVCQPNTIVVFGVECALCPPNQVPDKGQKKCIPCPAGTTFSFGQCIANKANSTPVGVATPGLLDSTPGLGSQGPAGVGTPRGGGTRGGAVAR